MTNLRRFAAALALGAMAFAFTGCNQSEGNSRIIPDILTFNENAPLQSDVYDFNGTPDDFSDDFVPIDVVEVTFYARASDAAQPVGGGKPFGSLRFTSYKVEFQDGVNSGGADLNEDGQIDLFNYEAPMNLKVFVNTNAQGFIEIVPIQKKFESPIVETRSGGSYRVSALITFYGTEETSGDAVSVQRGLDVTIGQMADD